MTAAAFSTIIVRFLSVGLFCYGVFGLISGIVAQRTWIKQFKALEAMSQRSDTISSSNQVTDDFGSMLSTLFGVAGGTIFIAILLYILSRRIGILLARGL